MSWSLSPVSRNVLILVIALTLMAHLGSIQQAWFVSLLFGAGVGSVLVLRWLWERITLFSELAAMAVSLVVAPILLITTDAEWLHLAVMGGSLNRGSDWHHVCDTRHCG